MTGTILNLVELPGTTGYGGRALLIQQAEKNLGHRCNHFLKILSLSASYLKKNHAVRYSLKNQRGKRGVKENQQPPHHK